jgi:hypothetical protein
MLETLVELDQLLVDQRVGLDLNLKLALLDLGGGWMVESRSVGVGWLVSDFWGLGLGGGVLGLVVERQTGYQ